MARPRKPKTPFYPFNSSPEVVARKYVCFPLSPRNVGDLLFERGIDISYETVRFWWNRFGPMFATEIRRKRSAQMRQVIQWRWRLDEVYLKMASCTTSGEPWIMRAKRWNPSSPRPGTRPRR